MLLYINKPLHKWLSFKKKQYICAIIDNRKYKFEQYKIKNNAE